MLFSTFRYLQENSACTFANMIGIVYERRDQRQSISVDPEKTAFHRVLMFNATPGVSKTPIDNSGLEKIVEQCREVGDRLFSSTIVSLKLLQNSSETCLTALEKRGTIPQLCYEQRRLQYWQQVLARMDGTWTTLLCIHDALDAGVNVRNFPRHIFICDALPRQLALTDDELAAVYAHEASHIALNHDGNTDYRYLLTMGSVVPLLITTTDYRFGLLWLLVCTAYYCFQKRMEEHQADSAAHYMLAAAGYKLTAFTSMLEKLRAASAREGGGFLNTHPALSERIRRSEYQTLVLQDRINNMKK